jgi:hypothetical protein
MKIKKQSKFKPLQAILTPSAVYHEKIGKTNYLRKNGAWRLLRKIQQASVSLSQH